MCSYVCRFGATSEWGRSCKSFISVLTTPRRNRSNASKAQPDCGIPTHALSWRRCTTQWNIIATAAKWARANANVRHLTHAYSLATIVFSLTHTALLALSRTHAYSQTSVCAITDLGCIHRSNGWCVCVCRFCGTVTGLEAPRTTTRYMVTPRNLQTRP